MGPLLEILGRAVTTDVAELVYKWLYTARIEGIPKDSARYRQLDGIIESLSGRKPHTAELRLKKYLEEYPDCLYARMAAGGLCLANAMLPQAIEHFNSVYLRQPGNTTLLYALGHCYERLGHEAQAVEFYQDCLKFRHYMRLPAERLAAVYFKNGQLERAIEQYELITREYRDDVSTLVLLAYLCIAAKKFQKAVGTFNAAILIHPDNFDTDLDRIEQLIADAAFAEASDCVELLLETEPDRPELIVRRADILNKQGRIQEAVEQYQHAARLCPDYLEAAIKLGAAHLQLTEEQLAAKQFNRAVEINDRAVDAYLGLSLAQKCAGDHDQALATLALAAAIQPNSHILFTQAITLRLKTLAQNQRPLAISRQPDQALAAILDAHRTQLQQKPANPDLWYRYGILLTAVGQIPQAAEAFTQALHINPAHTRARTKLILCLYETGQKQAALAALADNYTLAANDLDLHYKTALLYADRLKFASSLLNLQQSIETNYAASDATVNITVVLQNLGLLDRTAIMWDNLTDTAVLALHAADTPH